MYSCVLKIFFKNPLLVKILNTLIVILQQIHNILKIYVNEKITYASNMRHIFSIIYFSQNSSD